MTQLIINHTTRYTFDSPVDYALQKVRLRPGSCVLQQVEAWDVTVEGGKVEASYRDHYGNHVDLMSAEVGGTEMVIRAEGRVSAHDRVGVLGFDGARAPLWLFEQSTPLTTPGKGARRFAKVAAKGDAPLDSLHRLSDAILEAVPYDKSKTGAATTAEDAIEIGAGVCQDHSHIFISAARLAGFPARYVSGYLLMDGQIDQDANHAWAEAFVPNLGWVGFDVSNSICPDARYVRLAVGRDARDAAPVSGLRVGKGGETLMVSLQVQQ